MFRALSVPAAPEARASYLKLEGLLRSPWHIYPFPEASTNYDLECQSVSHRTYERIYFYVYMYVIYIYSYIYIVIYIYV